MPLTIRLRKQGRNNRQSFRLVLTDSRSPRDGKYLEKLGWYLPCEAKDNLFVDDVRVSHWVNQGAQVSENVENLLARGAPNAYKVLLNKRVAQKVKACAKRRALRRKNAGEKPEAPKKAATKTAVVKE